MRFAIGENVRVWEFNLPTVIEDVSPSGQRLPESNFYLCAVAVPGLDRPFHAWFRESALTPGEPQKPPLKLGQEVRHESSAYRGSVVTIDSTVGGLRYLVQWADQSRSWHVREELQ